MLPPGSPTTNLTIDVYNASKQPGDAKVGKHMILFEPAGGQMAVSETFLFTNNGKTAWNNPDQGTLQFFLPPAPAARRRCRRPRPAACRSARPVVKTAKPDVFAVDFPVKPGETRFDVSYTTPYTPGEPYAGKVAIEGREHVPDRAQRHHADGRQAERPRRRAAHPGPHLRTRRATPTRSRSPARKSRPRPRRTAEQAENSGPQIEQIMPRVNSQTKLILGLALGILASASLSCIATVGTTAHAGRLQAKESNERGRR